ncbi:MAG: elongation factor G [Christensenellales bacterium]|jgi:elongation factor G
MKEYKASHIRNIATIGHGGEGKTTLTEAMLFNAGVIDRMGRVEDGTTVVDYDPEEIKRQISISAAVAPFEFDSHKINIIDCPGYFDFIGEVSQAMVAADGALIVVGAASGVIVGTEKAWDACEQHNMPRMFVVNQMDREHVDFSKVLGQLKENYGTAIVPLQIPIVENEVFKGYIDVIDKKAYEFAGKGLKEVPVPENLSDLLESSYEAVVEAAAESDEELMEKYFEGEELTLDEIKKGLRDGVLSCSAAPVTCSAATIHAGVTTIIKDMISYMPSPADVAAAKGVNPKNNEEVERQCDDKAPFSAQVFKTVADPFVGKLSLFRVMSGKLTSDMTMYNSNAEKNEKVGTIYVMRGKKQTTVQSLSAGDIGAVAKLQYTVTGDTLCDQANAVKFPSIEFPKPSISLAVNSKKEGDEDKIFSGLHRLEEEDPTFSVDKNAETGDTMISGMGELHLEVICRKLFNKFNVEAVLVDPKIPYRETIKKAVKAEGKHKKQSGGHGQYGHCWIEFEPILDGSAEFEFIDKIVGGVVPRQYIPAVEKGLRESMTKGVLAGYPVVNVRCTLYDGSYHSVDSSEMAFKTAARLAFRKGCAQANPVILEPIYKVEVTIPDEYMGDVIGDMNRRRGRIMGMTPENGKQTVAAEAPLSEMFKYTTDLRSMTQARGSFTMEFERYEEAPANIAAKIVEQAKREDEDEE